MATTIKPPEIQVNMKPPSLGLRLLTLSLLAPFMALLLFQSGPPAYAQTNVVQIKKGGFGDPGNSYAWSMAWFKGKLYVGTARKVICVEQATTSFYFPGQFFPGVTYSTTPIPGFPVTCPADRYDLDLRAEIWQYTPSSNTWLRVFQSETIPNPRAPGKSVARDIGYRNMIVYTPPGGVETLYVGGVTAREYIPELTVVPRLLQSTDGQTFTPTNGGPGIVDTKFGLLPAIGYRAMAVFDGRLFATASNSLIGDGVIVEIGDPSGPNPTFTQVSPNTMAAYELDVFNGFLYVGTGDANLTTGQGTGYGVYKTNASGNAPFQYTPVVTNGAGRGVTITSVVAMHPFQGRLYVGAGSFASEMIRINPDDTWEVVVGNPRNTPQGLKSPISGLPDGFGNPFNAHVWRIRDHNGILYAGTNDWSWVLATTAANRFLRFSYGFDLFSSANGQNWSIVTQNAFGDGLYNFGSRTIVSAPGAGFIGSANHVQGTAIWAALPAQQPIRRGANTAVGGSGAAAPGALMAESQAASTVLSWEPVAGATRYRVLRAEYQSNKDLKVPEAPVAPLVEGVPRASSASTTWKLDDDAWIPGSFKPIGTTSDPYYVDRGARPNVRYAYQIQAKLRKGYSDPSNLTIVPTLTPPVEVDDLQAALGDRARRGKLKAATASQGAALAREAADSLARGDLSAAQSKVQELRQLLGQQRGKNVDDLDADDLDALLQKLSRRLDLAQVGLLKLDRQGAAPGSTE